MKIETLILTCLQAQLIVARIQKQNLPALTKTELVQQIQASLPKECVIK